MGRVGRPRKNQRPDECSCRRRYNSIRNRWVWEYCDLHKPNPPKFHRDYWYPVNPDTLIQTAKQIKDPCAKALFSFMYLTGCRIGETKDFSLNRLTVLEDRYVIRLRTLKQRDPRAMRKIILPRNWDKCHELEHWKIVLNYLKGFKNTDKPFFKWKHMEIYLRRHITIEIEAKVKLPNGDYIDKVFSAPLKSHFLRHCRATHLAEYYDFTDNVLCKMFGWVNPIMAQRYTKSVEVWHAFLRVAPQKT